MTDVTGVMPIHPVPDWPGRDRFLAALELVLSSVPQYTETEIFSEGGEQRTAKTWDAATAAEAAITTRRDGTREGYFGVTQYVPEEKNAGMRVMPDGTAEHWNEFGDGRFASPDAMLAEIERWAAETASRAGTGNPVAEPREDGRRD